MTFSGLRSRWKIPWACAAAAVVHGHDVRVVQRRGRTRLAPEPPKRRLFTEGAAQHELHRNGALQAQIPGLVNSAHAARPHQVVETVSAVDRPRHGQREPQDFSRTTNTPS